MFRLTELIKIGIGPVKITEKANKGNREVLMKEEPPFARKSIVFGKIIYICSLSMGLTYIRECLVGCFIFNVTENFFMYLSTLKD